MQDTRERQGSPVAQRLFPQPDFTILYNLLFTVCSRAAPVVGFSREMMRVFILCMLGVVVHGFSPRAIVGRTSIVASKSQQALRASPSLESLDLLISAVPFNRIPDAPGA